MWSLYQAPPAVHTSCNNRLEVAMEEWEEEIVWNGTGAEGQKYMQHDIEILFLTCDDWMRHGGPAADLVMLFNEIRDQVYGMPEYFVDAVNEMLDKTEPELYRRIVCEGREGSHWYLLRVMNRFECSPYNWDGNEWRLAKYNPELMEDFT
ncbi:hypothetical protein MPSEU_000860100 [Mayamaea pseudoterrestris]|nr:hypothetical protein MPSEU_000345500 [Mayamaea pseudoterrestris]GKY99044.1 hypothetical protein MPSEU_000860100 [Mayamaea pseudoterrestris]